MAKLKAYELQDHGRDTVEANVELGYAPDCRAYELPAEVLKMLGVSAIRLITNNPEKVAAMESAGITVTEARFRRSGAPANLRALSEDQARQDGAHPRFAGYRRARGIERLPAQRLDDLGRRDGLPHMPLRMVGDVNQRASRVTGNCLRPTPRGVSRSAVASTRTRSAALPNDASTSASNAASVSRSSCSGPTCSAFSDRNCSDESWLPSA